MTPYPPETSSMHACLFRTAALLLSFLLTVIGTPVRLSGQQVEPQAAYFVFDSPPSTDTFAISSLIAKESRKRGTYSLQVLARWLWGPSSSSRSITILPGAITLIPDQSGCGIRDR